eukprot:10380279-Lingulodinium_polyedra.AAC.1
MARGRIVETLSKAKAVVFASRGRLIPPSKTPLSHVASSLYLWACSFWSDKILAMVSKLQKRGSSQ